MAIPLLLAAAGTALQAGATIAGGIQSARGNKAAALASKIEGDLARLRVTQTRERSREQLSTMLGNISAIRSARGVSGDSMTGRAIERRTVADAYREEGIAALADITRAANSDAQARGYRSAARWAIPISVLQASGSALQSAGYLKAGMARPMPGGGKAVQPGGDLYGLY